MAPKRSFDLEDLSTSIPDIFDQAQSSSATHKKNCVALYKLHCSAALVTESGDGKGRHAADVKLVGEKAFADIFVDMVSRVLVVKKGIPAADRTVKFVGAYGRFLFEKCKLLSVVAQMTRTTKRPYTTASSSGSQGKTDDGDDDSPSSRFLSRLLKFLLKGTASKDKNVRYRVVSLISEIVVYLGEIEYVLRFIIRTQCTR